MQILSGVRRSHLLLAIVLSAREASAAPAGDWRAVFDAGSHALEQDDCQSALSSFEQARDLPNADPVVIYEIGEAQKCLQHSVEAAEAFSAYLAQSSDASPNNQRSHARDELKQLDAHLAELDVVSPLPDAAIRIDARPIRRAAPGRGQRLSPGTHLVTAESVTGQPIRREVTLSEGQHFRLELPEQDRGVLKLSCAAKGVDVALDDGRPISADSFGQQSLIAGRHRLTLRAATAHWEQAIEVPANAETTVVCAPKPESPPPPRWKAPGHGVLEIPRGYFVIGAGVAVAGAAVGVYLNNGARYDDWKATDRALNANPDTAARAQNNRLADKIGTYNVVTVVLALTSGALIGGGVALLAWDSREQGVQDPRAALAGFSVALSDSSKAVAWSHAW